MNPNRNAFPTNTTGCNVTYGEQGLTQRVLFAAMAMQGLLAKDGWFGWTKAIAKDAVSLADALIAELSE